jgi:hypothetical protein
MAHLPVDVPIFTPSVARHVRLLRNVANQVCARLWRDRSPNACPFSGASMAVDADLVLLLIGVEHRDRVAVGNPNYAAGNDPGVAGEGR